MFDKIKSWVSKHPYIAVAIVAIFIGIYYVLSRGSSSATSASSTDATNAYDVQLAQLQAAEANTQIQANSQIAIANTQAGVATDQINAQLAAVQDTDKTQVSLATVETGAQTAQLSGEESTYEKIYSDLFNYENKQLQLNNQLSESQSSATNAELSQYLSFIGPPGSGRYGPEAVAGIQSIVGDSAGAVASSNNGATQALASALQTQSILSSISGAASSIFGGLF